ncbi:MAG: hypothetical protein GXP14_07435 [Gammaproteobacteria bacterium]|nr:hypothetical protein [Gammaproteobacteria bacterium]
MNIIPSPSEDRQEHHVNLVEAINHIDSVQSRLDELYCRIRGPEPEESKVIIDTNDAMPTLSGVLNSAPDHIRSKTEKLHKRIDAISASIF